MNDDFVWRVTKTATGEPNLETGPLLESILPNDYLPLIAEKLNELAIFLYKLCLSGTEIKIEREEDYEFE